MRFALAAFLALALTACGAEKNLLDIKNSSTVTIGDFCSGNIIDVELDLIATANHCVMGNKSEFEVFQVIYDKEGNVLRRLKFHTVVIGTDPKNDVAILQVQMGDLQGVALKLNTAPVYFGDTVFTVGNPMMIEGTLAKGMVTKPKIGPFPMAPQIPEDAIVHDAFMNKGSSGGALLNADGELIGLTNWGAPGGPYMATRAIHVINLVKMLNVKAN